MKLSDIEKSQLKLLYNQGYRFMARDDCAGLRAYRSKPFLCVSHTPGIKFRNWVSMSKGTFFMPNDYFLGVGYHETEPYMITKTFNLRLCTPTKRR